MIPCCRCAFAHPVHVAPFRVTLTLSSLSQVTASQSVRTRTYGLRVIEFAGLHSCLLEFRPSGKIVPPVRVSMLAGSVSDAKSSELETVGMSTLSPDRIALSLPVGMAHDLSPYKSSHPSLSLTLARSKNAYVYGYIADHTGWICFSVVTTREMMTETLR